MKVVVYLPAPARDVAALLKFVGTRWPGATVDNSGEIMVIETPPTNERNP